MKKQTKFLFALLAVLLLSAVMCVSAFAAGGSINNLSIQCYTDEDAPGAGSVTWTKASDGKYYIYLPDGTSPDSLTLNFLASDNVFCGNRQIISGQRTSVFASGGEFTLSCGDTAYQVVILNTENVGTVYLNTQSGNLDYVHANKENKEPGTILVVDSDGAVQYSGGLEYIKGRGNSTWTVDSQKKPYNIKLDGKADLFEMGKSKKWCLLANIADGALMRNQLAFNIGAALGVSYAIESQSVNLYINGEYRGLYLITEKVEIDDNRVEINDLEKATEEANSADLDTYTRGGRTGGSVAGTIKYVNIPNDPEDITGGYLLELEKTYRYVNEISGFVSTLGQCVVVKTPEYASKAQVEYISEYYQEFEDAFYSHTGYNSLGKHYSEYIDVDSLAKMYILLEYTSNFDGCSSSFYLSKDIDGKLIAGPGWDFDLAIGYLAPNDLINHVANVGDPNILYIGSCFIGNHQETEYGFAAQARNHDDFMAAVRRIWKDSFVPSYQKYLSSIGTYAAQLQSSAVANNIRWELYSTTNPDSQAQIFGGMVDGVSQFSTARYSFLSNAFAEDSYIVRYHIGEYGAALVTDYNAYKKGSAATVMDAPKGALATMVFSCWTTNPDGTGDIYIPGNEITADSDITLYAQWQSDIRISSVLTDIFNSLHAFLQSILQFLAIIFG